MAAASLTVILVVSYFFLFSPDTRDAQQLFSAYYKPYYNVIDDYKRGGNATPSETEAFRLYEQKEYESAINAFEKGLSEDPENIPLLFYGGLSYLAADEMDKAISMLDRVVTSKHTLKEAAEWYLALAYLKNNDLLQSKKIVEDIAGHEGAYKDKATSLLQELH
jgi:tetratricopeptide (TPR) repeat protein